MTEAIEYTAPPTVAKFMASLSRNRLIIGPFGSGKSSGCVMEILRRATQQEPSRNGLRQTKWAVIRNSYRELKDTTQRTVEDWIPREIYEYRVSDASAMIKFNDVECEILYRALENPEDVKKLLSLEITGAWINEAKEVPKAVFEALQGRLRFPSKKMVPPTATSKGGATWRGVMMDTNPPDSDHWIYRVFEEEKPEGYEVFHQPSGLSPEAENLVNLPDRYYQDMVPGKLPEWVNVYVHGYYGYVRDGRPVYPEWKDTVHLMKSPPIIKPFSTLILGMDFGLTPAISVILKTPMQYQVIDEFVSDDMGANRIAQHVARELKRKYPDCVFRGWGDPAGSQRSQVDETTPYDIVNAAGLPISPVDSNDFVRRRESVAGALTRLNLNGEPSLVVSPLCTRTRKAMAGGYAFKRVQVSGEERYQDAPNKNQHSHIAEALQYAMLGEGEDASALGKSTDFRSAQYKVKRALTSRRR